MRREKNRGGRTKCMVIGVRQNRWRAGGCVCLCHMGQGGYRQLQGVRSASYPILSDPPVCRP